MDQKMVSIFNSSNLTILGNATISVTFEIHRFAPRSFYYVLFILSILLAMITLMLNSIFLITAYHQHIYKTLNMKLLMILSCVDSLQGLITWPLVGYVLFENYLNKSPDFFIESVLISICYEFVFATIMVIFLIAFEQFLAILYPYVYQLHMNWKLLFIPSLLITLVVGALDVLCSTVYTSHWDVFTKVAVSLTTIIFILTVYFYCRIWFTSYSIRRKIKQQNLNLGIHIKRQTKAAKTSAIILITFALCYIPKISYDILHVYPVCPYLGWVIAMLALFKSVLNPLIYYWRLAVVRKATKKVFSNTCSKSKSSQTTSTVQHLAPSFTIRTASRTDSWYMSSNI